MKTRVFAAVMTAVIAAPAAAATPDCSGGYKTFIDKIAPLVNRIEDADLPLHMRRALSVFDACVAGDTFSPHGIWDEIAAKIESDTKK